MKPTRALITTNEAYDRVTPRLSILIPFYRESPCALLRAIDDGQEFPRDQVEIVLLDDGSAKPELYHEVAACAESLSIGVKFVCLSFNEGRSKGRNRLANEARGAYYLFIDADMLPDSSDFVLRWLELMTHAYPAVAFGGFSLLQASKEKRFAIHRTMAQRSDCLNAVARQANPEKYVFTSNLLIRADVFEEERFDAQFYGWGWEDVEWAMRIQTRHKLTHIDNTSTHMGLDSVDLLIRKYDQSVNNFARVVKKHPEIIGQYPSFTWAKRLKAVPGLSFWRKRFRDLARCAFAPLNLRAVALRLYRCSLYAKVV